MRKISNGFTLIELLLTMGIIGIVAALTIPGLVSKFSNAHFGATLGSTAQRIELGLRNLIDTANKNYAANGESTTDLLTTIKTKTHRQHHLKNAIILLYFENFYENFSIFWEYFYLLYRPVFIISVSLFII